MLRDTASQLSQRASFSAADAQPESSAADAAGNSAADDANESFTAGSDAAQSIAAVLHEDDDSVSSAVEDASVGEQAVEMEDNVSVGEGTSSSEAEEELPKVDDQAIVRNSPSMTRLQGHIRTLPGGLPRCFRPGQGAEEDEEAPQESRAERRARLDTQKSLKADWKHHDRFVELHGTGPRSTALR